MRKSKGGIMKRRRKDDEKTRRVREYRGKDGESGVRGRNDWEEKREASGERGYEIKGREKQIGCG